MDHKRRSSLNHVLASLVALVIIGSLLSSCALVLKPENNPTSTPESEIPAPALVDITFKVQIPAWAVGEGRLAIEILDEVTGLPYNPLRYDLDQVSEQLYQVTLPFPSGSVVKYRYVKISGGIIAEAGLDGEPIRYRMFYATTPESVTDILQSWEGESITTETGTLTGILTDPITNAPIPDILVSAAGHMTFTDANGRFAIHHIVTGVHNVVFYALDGHYKTFQQGATISDGLTTPAEIVLLPMPLVNVTFIISMPNDALGVPVFLAGNLKQLGNTFTDLPGGMSIKPKWMPMLTPMENGTQFLTLQLYAETDLRYKFTLGDGYWNSEQDHEANPVIRQLIIPNHDVTLQLNVESWRSLGFEPVTFQVKIPPETSPSDEKYIQFKTSEWTEPIPLWHLGSGNYLYILFSPFSATTSLSYRFCRNEFCDLAKNLTSDEPSVQPGTTAQSIPITITSWENWQPINDPPDVIAANIPQKDPSFLTGVELSQDMTPSWINYGMYGLTSIVEIDADSVIFSPEWFPQPGSFALEPKIGKTPFSQDLIKLIADARSLGLSTLLFPQLGNETNLNGWWLNQSRTDIWWANWYAELERFYLHFARIAGQSGSERLIIGGKAVLPSFTDGQLPDGSLSDAPESSDAIWRKIITDIRGVYGGKIVWATNANQNLDPLPSFIDAVDEIYVIVDTPLASGETTTVQEMSDNFSVFMDTKLFEVYQNAGKPMMIALGYPSVSEAHQGCFLVSENCSHDGLFEYQEMSGYEPDLGQQVSIYIALLPIVANRDWISGLTVRGYEPVVEVLGPTSSVAGKPAEAVIWYWFKGLK